MNIIGYKKVFYIISALATGIGIIHILLFGFRLGLDFTGGSLMEVKLNYETNNLELQEKIKDLNFDDVTILSTSEGTWILRMKDLGEEEHQKILLALLGEKEQTSGNITVDDKNIQVTQTDGTPLQLGVTTGKSISYKEGEELLFESIGPSLGKELRNKSISSIIIVLFGILIYVAWAFRKVSHPVSSWRYGIIAIVALFHDILIVMGLFSVLGKWFQIEINTYFVAALLTVLGYSVNDTIVIFDRIRENLKKHIGGNFEETVNMSLNQTMRRSVFTSSTVFLVLLALYFFGGATLHFFVLALLVGVFAGTYSSIFLASPLLVSWEKRNFKG